MCYAFAMARNTFGEHYRVTTFGESHGPAIGAVIDGCPAGIEFDSDALGAALARRRPGQSAIVTDRAERDEPRVLSGVHEGRTLGTPIAVVIENHDARPADYAQIARSPRPGHADDTWAIKFGHTDPRGGGRASGRETATRVIGGAVARMVANAIAPDLHVAAFARAIGPFRLSDEEADAVPLDDVSFVDRFTARYPSPTHHAEVETLLATAKRDGKSYGGVIEVRTNGVPAGLGQPVAHKLKADLAAAYMSIGATSGIECGAGFEAADAEGSSFHRRPDDASPYGGIRGGISTGEPIVCRIAFKPTATVLDEAKRGRHDPCIVPRAVPVVEAVTWMVITDHLLWRRTDRILPD